MNLFQLGDFTLHSGQKSRWKIDCNALTDKDWETLATMLVERLPKFGHVYGIPSGGIELAKQLAKYGDKDTVGLPLLLVDDVCSTGQSLEELRARLLSENINHIIGVVVFARGKCPLGLHHYSKWCRIFNCNR